MIFKKTENPEYRLRNVLISDKQFNQDRLNKIIKSDVFSLLSNYCEIIPEDITTNIEIADDGTYKFSIVATSNRLKIFGSLPEIY